jgi:hypothetical protein
VSLFIFARKKNGGGRSACKIYAACKKKSSRLEVWCSVTMPFVMHVWIHALFLCVLVPRFGAVAKGKHTVALLFMTP